MAISQNDRERFQEIGRDQVAFALATGKLQSLGMTEDTKVAAIEWVAEQDAERDRVQRTTLRYAKIAAWAAIVGVFVSILAIIVGFITGVLIQ